MKSKKTEKDSLIHVRLECGESIESKRNLISLEADILKIARAMKKYRNLRIEELREKSRLSQKVKDLKANINNIQKNIPKIKIPNFLQKIGEEREIEKIKTKFSRERVLGYDKDLEVQLQEIQEKLRAISG